MSDLTEKLDWQFTEETGTVDKTDENCSPFLKIDVHVRKGRHLFLSTGSERIFVHCSL